MLMTINNVVFVLCILKLLWSVYNLAGDAGTVIHIRSWLISDIVAICLSFLCIYLKNNVL